MARTKTRDYAAFRCYALACVSLRLSPPPASASAAAAAPPPPLPPLSSPTVDFFFTFLPLAPRSRDLALSYVFAVFAVLAARTSSLLPSICMHLHLYSSRRPAAASLLPPFLPLAPRERSVGRAKAAGTPKRAAAAAERARGEEVAADNKQRMKRAREGGEGGGGDDTGKRGETGWRRGVRGARGKRNSWRPHTVRARRSAPEEKERRKRRRQRGSIARRDNKVFAARPRWSRERTLVTASFLCLLHLLLLLLLFLPDGTPCDTARTNATSLPPLLRSSCSFSFTSAVDFAFLLSFFLSLRLAPLLFREPSCLSLFPLSLSRTRISRGGWLSHALALTPRYSRHARYARRIVTTRPRALESCD